MVFGRPTTLEAVLEAIRLQAGTAGTWITDTYSVLSIDGFPTPEQGFPADSLIVVQVPRGRANQADLAGGMNEVLTWELAIRVTLWDRFGGDEGYRDTVRIADQTLGVLKKWRDLLKVLNYFKPTVSSECILEEPMRVLDFDVTPRMKAHDWVSVGTVFEVKFRQDMT